jgi:hypothetical protein
MFHTVSLLPMERLGLVVTWRISLNIEETYNTSDLKGRPKISTVSSVIVVKTFISLVLLVAGRMERGGSAQ